MFKRILTIVLIVAALAGISTSAALAADDKPDDPTARKCTYAGQEYSHRAVIKGSDGRYYRCDFGEWVEVKPPKPCECKDQKAAKPSGTSRPLPGKLYVPAAGMKAKK
jgi:hypothetical protein